MIPENPDWNRIILDLKRAKGWTDRELAAKIGRTKSTITTLKNGLFGDVRFSIAAPLLNLHEKIVKNHEEG